MSTTPEPPLSREERLRRVCLVAYTFARNMACYRSARNGGPDYAGPVSQFWVTADGNFIDMAVLEWCKLFGDTRAHHAARKVVSDPDKFETDLLAHIGLAAVEFAELVDVVRTYRDKFVAHLDSERTMTPPKLDVMWAAIQFYYKHVIDVEMNEAEFAGWRAKLDQTNTNPDIAKYYIQSLRDAQKQHARGMG